MNAYVKFYDFFVHHNNELPTLLQLLADFPSGAKIFEGGTGTGRLAIPLAERGFNVSGYEKSPEMLKVLARKLMNVEESVREKISVEQKDFTEIDFPENSFDFAFFSSNTLLLVTDFIKQQSILNQIHKILKDTGMLYLEMLNPSGFFKEIADRTLIQLYSRVNPQTDIETAHFVSYLHDPLEQILIASNIIEEFPERENSRRYFFKEIIRYLHLQQMLSMLEVAGFSKISVFTGENFEKLTSSSIKMKIIAKK